MLNLAKYRSKAQTLADFRPWAALVGEGDVLNKDEPTCNQPPQEAGRERRSDPDPKLSGVSMASRTCGTHRGIKSIDCEPNIFSKTAPGVSYASACAVPLEQ